MSSNFLPSFIANLLVRKIMQGQWSESDQQALDSWLAESIENRRLYQEFSDPERLMELLGEAYKAEANILQKIKAHVPEIDVSMEPEEFHESGGHIMGLVGRFRWMAAAVFILLVGIGALYLLRSRKAPDEGGAIVSTDIAPGGRKATLTLGNGQTIALQDAKEGDLTKEGRSMITRTAGGMIRYTADHSSNTSDTLLYNTLTVPRGGTYTVVLPDSSLVYLNSASSLRYPVSFERLDHRVVELTGEGYFEIAKDAARPFQVRVAGTHTHLDILGTRFNVNAYRSSITTTLLQGSIRVNEEHSSLVLTPGQLANADSAGIRVVKQVDTATAVAWTRGEFRFDHLRFVDIMDQLSRWYDIDIKYNVKLPEGKPMSGVISRDLPLSTILQSLSVSSGYTCHFIVENKVVIVQP